MALALQIVQIIGSDLSTGKMAKLRLWRFICDKHHQAGRKLSGSSQVYTQRSSTLGGHLPALGCCHQVALHCEKGQGCAADTGELFGDG